MRAILAALAVAAGGCELILGISDPSLGSDTGGDAGGGSRPDTVVDGSPVGTVFVCDLVNQTNCAAPSDACYFEQTPPHGSFCAPVPSMSLGAAQGAFCGGNPCGNDSCDKGYVPLGQFSPGEMVDRCAFLCSPVPTHTGNPDDGAGDPNGVPCTAEFDGARPDGPGAGFQCRFVNAIHAPLSMLPPSIGICVDVERFGDCRTCDLAAPGSCPPGCLPPLPP